MHAEHGDPVVMRDLSELVAFHRLRFKPLHLFEQVLGGLQTRAMFPDHRDGETLQFLGGQIIQEDLDGIGCLNQARPECDVTLNRHKNPAAWSAVRPRKHERP